MLLMGAIFLVEILFTDKKQTKKIYIKYWTVKEHQVKKGRENKS